MLTELLDTDSGLLVSLHIRSMDQNEAIKTVKRKITDIDRDVYKRQSLHQNVVNVRPLLRQRPVIASTSKR